MREKYLAHNGHDAMPPDVALYLASEEGHTQAVRTLLNRGVNPNWVQVVGAYQHIRSPLHIASMKGHVAIVSLLLEHGADPNLQVPQHPFWPKPLHKAIEFGQVSVVKLLLEKGGRVDAPYGLYRKTPLHLTVEAGRVTDINRKLGIVKLLLNHGANINHRDTEGRTPLWYAVASESSNAIPLVKLLLRFGANPTPSSPICTACQLAPPEVVKDLLKAGANPNATCLDLFKNRVPLLHHVIYQGRHNPKDTVDIIKLLLEHGAKPNARNAIGETALHVAVVVRDVRIVQLLIKHGARATLKNDAKQTPVEEAERLAMFSNQRALTDIVQILKTARRRW
jgi:ankyrin repeat protein